jgi:hypothetical protein
MKISSYKRPRIRRKCSICGKEYVIDKAGRIPRHFDKTNSKIIGSKEYPCSGSGRRGLII